MNKNAPSLYIPPTDALPDNRDYTNRFEIKSETSNRKYIVSQHITKRHWCCSCMGWIRFRKCKHLGALSLPAYEQPHEVNVVK
jgi:hypothetical protein